MLSFKRPEHFLSTNRVVVIGSVFFGATQPKKKGSCVCANQQHERGLDLFHYCRKRPHFLSAAMQDREAWYYFSFLGNGGLGIFGEKSMI